MDLLFETADTRAMRDSKKGASKQFLKDFDKAFKKRSKELGYGKLKKIVKIYVMYRLKHWSSKKNDLITI